MKKQLSVREKQTILGLRKERRENPSDLVSQALGNNSEYTTIQNVLKKKENLVH